MNKAICLLVASLLFVGCATYYVPNGYKPLTDSKDEKLYVKHDEFENVNFIRHSYFFDTILGLGVDVPVEIYEVQNSNLRIVFKYYGADWIFFNEVIVINSSGQKLVFDFNSFQKDTEVLSGGMVFEKIDMVLSDIEAKRLLELLSSSDTKKIRLSGKYNRDYTIGETKTAALKDIILHYFDKKSD